MNRFISILLFLMLVGSGVAISSGSIYTGSLVLPNGATISSTPGAQVHIISNSTNTAAYNYVLEEQGGCGSSGWMNIVLNTVPKANIDCSGGYNTATGSGVFVNLTASGLAANQCVQTTSGGLLTTGGGAPCSGDIASIVGTLPITITNGTGPSPNVSCPTCVHTTPSPGAAGNIAWSGSWPYTATVATPSPTVTATGCSTLVASGSFPYTITENTTGCQVADSTGTATCQTGTTCSTIPGPLLTPAPLWSPGNTCLSGAICAACNLDNNCSSSAGTPAGCFAIEQTQTTPQNGVMAYINRVGVSPTYTWVVWYNATSSSISTTDTQQFVANWRCGL